MLVSDVHDVLVIAGVIYVDALKIGAEDTLATNIAHSNIVTGTGCRQSVPNMLPGMRRATQVRLR